jgi:hypothetical protein
VTRGGARLGAGRKGLSPEEKLDIGRECQRRWDELAKRLAMEQWEALPTTQRIMAAQARTQMIPVRLRGKPLRPTRETLEDVHEDIDAELGNASRLVTIPIKRPYGARPQIMKEVAAWAQKLFGLQVTSSQVRESWKVWSEFRRSPEYQALLNSPQS